MVQAWSQLAAASTATDSADDPEGDFGSLDRLDVALSRLRRLWDQPGVRAWLTSRLDLDSMEASAFRTLRAIDQLGAVGASVNGVAKVLRIDASTASRFLDRAGIAGLVQRAPSPNDRRRSSFTLTDLGIEQLRQLRETRVTMLGELTTGWPTADLDGLVALLTRLDDAVQELSVDDDG
jgi:DNA-binding MarR family transcriptional regulator